MNRKWETNGGCQVWQILNDHGHGFLISDGIKNILVDTGRAKDRRQLFLALESHHVKALQALFITHAHYDHVQNAAEVKRRYGAPVIIHSEERMNLCAGKSSAIKGAMPFTRLLTNTFDEYIERGYRYEPVEPDIVFNEQYEIPDFGCDLRIIHTPGHTRGSSCMIIDGGIVLAGDTVFHIFRNSVFPPFAEDPVSLMQSWKLLLDTGCNIFLPAHGGAISRDLLQRQYEKHSVKLTGEGR